MVIAVLALFAAVIMPNLKNQKHSQEVRQFFSAARNLMVEARERAIDDGRARKIQIDETAKKMTVEISDAATGANQPNLNPNQQQNQQVQAGQTERSIDIPDGITAESFRVGKDDSSSGEWALNFYADGHSEGGAIQFSANGADQTLIVQENGAVQVQKGDMPDISQDEWDAGGYTQRA